MKISLHNYEAYLLDYLEGNLNQVRSRQLKDFLEKHPELKDELESFETQPIAADEVRFKNAEKLFRTYSDIDIINEKNFEEHCIAYYEGELNEAGKRKLEKFTEESSTRKALFQLHEQIHFSPNENIKYSGRKELIRPVQRKIYFWIYVSSGVAAALVLLLILGRGLTREPDLPAKSIYVEKSVPEHEVINRSEKKQKLEKVVQSKPNKRWGKPIPPQNVMAAFDTNDSRKQEKVVLAQLAIREVELVASGSKSLLAKNEIVIAQASNNTQSRDSGKDAIGQDKNQYMLGRKKEDLIVGAVNLGLKGFNNLTENSLAVVAEKDGSGNIQRFRVGNERFGFSRKIRRDM